MQKSIYILVCASVRTCDDPLESFNLFNLLVRGRHARFFASLNLFFYAYCVRVLVNLEYRIDVRIFKAQFFSGST